MGVCVPEEYGGAGADFVSYILVLEELSRADAGVGVTVAVHTSAVDAADPRVRHRRAARALRAAARAGRPVRRLRADRAGGRLGCGVAADVRDARRRRAGGSPGRSASSRPRGTPGRSCSSRAPTSRPQDADGVSAFVLDAEHVTVTRDEEKLGLNSSTTSDIAVDAVVDGDRLLHEEGKGFQVAMATLDGGRIGIAAQAVGIARAAYEAARRVRGGAAAVREADRRAAGDPAQARRHVDGDRRCAAARAARGVAEGAGSPARRGGREGEALRLGGRPAPDRGGDPDLRRLRVHEGVPGRALLPRREDHRDLRGDERDPAARDRALDPRAASKRQLASG